MNSNLRPASTVCPMCGRGHLSPMILMEALSCSFCQHMFLWDPHQQRLEILDVSSPTAWRWDGDRWQRRLYPSQPITVITLVFAIVVILLPAVMIEVAAYIFPPLPGSPFEYFHVFWATTALLLHGAWVFWIFAESYHFTAYTLAKIKLRKVWSWFHHQHA